MDSSQEGAFNARKAALSLDLKASGGLENHLKRTDPNKSDERGEAQGAEFQVITTKSVVITFSRPPSYDSVSPKLMRSHSTATISCRARLKREGVKVNAAISTERGHLMRFTADTFKGFMSLQA